MLEIQRVKQFLVEKVVKIGKCIFISTVSTDTVSTVLYDKIK